MTIWLAILCVLVGAAGMLVTIAGVVAVVIVRRAFRQVKTLRQDSGQLVERLKEELKRGA